MAAPTKEEGGEDEGTATPLPVKEGRGLCRRRRWRRRGRKRETENAASTVTNNVSLMFFSNVYH